MGIGDASPMWDCLAANEIEPLGGLLFCFSCVLAQGRLVLRVYESLSLGQSPRVVL